MRVAIIHDWLTGMRGGEKVLEVFCELFPAARIHTLVRKNGAVSPAIERMQIRTSFLQAVPSIERNYRNYLPLFPLAVESFDLRGFDLVISSSHCVAKGAKKARDAYHLCYCYTPMRYVWTFFEQYFGNQAFIKKQCIAGVARYLKAWDIATLSRVDDFIAISRTIQERIMNAYARPSTVIYPPVDTENFFIRSDAEREDYYVCVSALVPYKRLDILIEAFNRLRDKKLLIVGDGNIRRELEKKRISDNIFFCGWVPDGELLRLYQRARAFLYAAEEDFGIAPLEAQACGTPVISFGRGGVSETVVPLGGAAGGSDPTGVFFFQQSAEAVIEAVEEFERRRNEFSAEKNRENALRFSREKFKERMQQYVLERVNAHRAS